MKAAIPASNLFAYSTIYVDDLPLGHDYVYIDAVSIGKVGLDGFVEGNISEQTYIYTRH